MKQYQREIDELGRVVSPKEVREALGFEPKKTVGITLLDDVIVITPKGAVCSICGKPILAKAKYKLCADCVKTIKEDGEDIPVKTRSVTERCMDARGLRDANYHVHYASLKNKDFLFQQLSNMQ